MHQYLYASVPVYEYEYMELTSFARRVTLLCYILTEYKMYIPWIIITYS